MNFKDYSQEVALFIPSLTPTDDLAIIWDGGTQLESYLINKDTGDAKQLTYVTVYGVTNLREAKEYAAKFARAMEDEINGTQG